MGRRVPWADVEDLSDDDYSEWSTLGSSRGTSRSGSSMSSRIIDAAGSDDDHNEEQNEASDTELPPQALEQVLAEPEYLDLLARVPKLRDGTATSIGSIDHFKRACIKCKYRTSPSGCRNGIQCTFCHIPHPRRQRYRPCKQKRDRQKARAARTAASLAEAASTGVASSGAPDSAQASLTEAASAEANPEKTSSKMSL